MGSFSVNGISVTSATCCPNWRNWVEHKIYAIHEKICGLCTTESKVHALLVLGRALQAAALVGLPAAIGCAFAVGPIALIGLVPAVALGILGTWIAENPSELNDAVQMGRPFVNGQPIGLSNGRNNCWLNSSLQLMANTPSFERRMRQVPDLARFLDGYRAAGVGFQKVATEIDTHQIRQLLHRETAGRVESGFVQQDAAQFFEWLFQGPGSLYQFDQVHNGAPATPRREPMIQLDIDRDAPIPAFEQLFSRFFDHQTDLGQRLQLFFPTAPDDLLIQIKRFYRDRNGTEGKINDPIETPMGFQLPAHLVRAGGSASYQCDAFLVHHGGAQDAGHYIAYIKRGNAWWYCSDTIVYEVSSLEAQVAMKQSYILHYAKNQ